MVVYWSSSECGGSILEFLVLQATTLTLPASQRRSDKLRNRAIIDLVLRDRKGRRKGCTQNVKHTTYATAVCSSFWRFVGQATANEGSFVLPRWRKLGRQP